MRKRRIFNYLMPCEWMSVDEIAIFHYMRRASDGTRAGDRLKPVLITHNVDIHIKYKYWLYSSASSSYIIEY